MQKIILLALVLVAVSAQFDFKTFSEEIANEVNAKRTTWTAGYNSHFEGWNFQQIKNLMGSLPTPPHLQLAEKWRTEAQINALNAPENYDPREEYPNCESIKEVRDQSNCGSCWAFGSVEAMSDRICITSGQKEQTRVSSENLLSCCIGIFGCGNGCNGGYTSASWDYFVKTGLVTGDLYTDEDMKSSEFCQPYAFPPCSHHVVGTYEPCDDLPTFSTPSCSKSCNSDFTSESYGDNLIKGSSSYSVPRSEDQIIAELIEHGSTTASFTVYSDFLTYSGGVYQHETGSYMGGHAIKMIGYGVTDDGTKYWLCANSWNETWGEKGFFKILRGENECGIESGMVAGLVAGQTDKTAIFETE